MSKLIAFAARFFQEEDAPTAVEYGLMVALIAVVVITGATALGVSVDSIFTAVSGEVDAVAPSGGGT